MPVQATGRTGTRNILGQHIPVFEFADPVTGNIKWGTDAANARYTGVTNIQGSYSGDFLQAEQNVLNAKQGGLQGALSVTAAQADPRGTMANVINSMSDDFFATAVPVKNDLIATTTYNGNKGVVDDLKSKGMAQVQQSFDNAQGVATRNTQRYGMAQTKEQAEAQASSLSSGKALAEVDTLNSATQFQQDLNKQLVSGMGSPAGITK